MILPTILTLRAGGGASTPIFGLRAALRVHIWHSERPPLSSYIWCWKRAPLSTHIWHSERPSPRFQAIYGVESVPPPRFQPIFGTQSAPPLSSSIWCWERALLSTHIWHSERPPAFKLYFVLKAGPYLVFRASEQRGALNAKYGLKAGHALNTIYRFKAEGRSECQIWTWSAALSLKMGVKGFHIVN